MTTPLKVSGAGLNALAEQVGEARPAAGTITDSAGVPVPHFVNREKLALAEQLEASELKALEDHFTAAPATPDEHKLAPLVPGQEPIPPEELTALRGAAHSIGVSQGEFATLQHVLQKIEIAAGDPRMERKAADAMGRELERRYGDVRAEQIAGYAVAAIKGAKGLHPNIIAALRQEILTNRPLLELLARIGERHAKQKR